MKNIKQFTTKNATLILSIIGCIGVAATAISSAKAGITVYSKIKNMDDIDTKDKVKAIIPDIIIPAAVGMATISSIVAAQCLNKAAIDNVKSSCLLLSSGLYAYRDKVKELYGAEADNKIRESIHLEKMKDPATYADMYDEMVDLDVVNDTNESGKLMFYDSFGARYFETTLSRVLLAEYNINRTLQIKGCAYLNEFYDYLGLDEIDTNHLGWDMELFSEDCVMWIEFNHINAKVDTNLNCCVIETMLEPVPLDY